MRGTRATRVGITTGYALCRGCDLEWWHPSSEERVLTMRRVRKHVSETGHTVDFEDAIQTTVEPVEED